MDFYYALLIFLVNTHGLFLRKVKKILQLLMLLWVDKGSAFYNRSMKSWLKNAIEIYSLHNEGKSLVAERFIIALKNKIYKYDFNIRKCVY